MSEWPFDDLPSLGGGRRPAMQAPDGPRTLLSQRLETDAEAVERDLMKLVLTIIELVRQLMEKQALRRVDEGDLTDEQVEGLGNGLMHLEQAMEDLKRRYGLTADDLNIDLGPLGTLLPE
ncbi:gas vesicle protein K [Nocardioides sp. URHA0032]|uniref:gas vesicle protein K n=1 Tax=Nocardioides sp. URHA0032 TaxID=1380388 RepID=UPI001E5787B8|nr:gas vesicle protein K [Nocardioides sp. URHA0032]